MKIINRHIQAFFKCLLFPFCMCAQLPTNAQQKATQDTLPDYDVLFEEFANFLDSLTRPKSFVLVQAGLFSARFEYQQPGSDKLEEKGQVVLNPAVAYYHKSGLSQASR